MNPFVISALSLTVVLAAWAVLAWWSSRGSWLPDVDAEWHLPADAHFSHNDGLLRPPGSAR